MSAFFSIILPTFNRAHRLNRAIDSILSQTFIHWELIIVDDASTDDTSSFIQPYQSDDRIRYIRNESNMERCISRNIGIEAAQGEFICFLDSDDYHLPHHLERLHSFLQNQQFPKAFLFSNAYNETEEGKRSDRFCPDFPSVDTFTYFLRYTVNPQRWCVHREVMLKHLFDPEVVICEDMDTSLRIAAAGHPIMQIPERTTVYVAASDSFTHGDPKKWEKELFYLKRIFHKPELKTFLPKKETRRLVSMCYFHLAQQSSIRGERQATFRNTLKSIFYFPSGYKHGLLKINLVLLFYHLPLFGWAFKKLVQKKKQLKVALPLNISEEHRLLIEPFSSYAIPETSIHHARNILVTPEGLYGKWGILSKYSAFNLRTRKDKNFYFPFAKHFMEQSIVSWKGNSLKRYPLPGKSLIIHTKWFNYGFWLNSSLVRLLLAEKAGMLKQTELLYPANWDGIRYVNESLRLFPELKIRQVPADELYQCDELYYAPVRPYTGALDPEHVQLVRDEIPKRLEIGLVEPHRKIYITRQKRGVRLPENEEEIIALLITYGFEIVDFDELSFKEQVTLMTETKILISIHGAGMANINFMQKGTSVIELINEPYAQAEYTFPFWKLGTLNELRYYVLFCKVEDKNRSQMIDHRSNSDETDYLVNQNILVDTKKLKTCVDLTI
jgi:glycosyltransferase involved in cell wall biosynthesis